MYSALPIIFSHFHVPIFYHKFSNQMQTPNLSTDGIRIYLSIYQFSIRTQEQLYLFICLSVYLFSIHTLAQIYLSTRNLSESIYLLRKSIYLIYLHTCFHFRSHIFKLNADVESMYLYIIHGSILDHKFSN